MTLPNDQPVILAPAPRTARLKRKVTVTGSTIALCVVALGGVIGNVGWMRGRDLERLRDDGVVTNGKVEDKTTSRSRRSTRYRLEYSFSHDGIVVHGSGRVSKDSYASYAVGDPIVVTYQRSDPNNNQLFYVGQEQVSSHYTAMAIIGGILATVAGGLGFYALGIYRRRLHLARNGSLVAARVGSIGRRIKQRNRTIEFEITTSDGEVIRKKHRMHESRIAPGSENTSVDYLIDPLDPRRGEPLATVLAACELVE
ncbi:MAG: DUF3592 domain-containing protein [Planctomycetota bacterium]